MGGQCPKLKGKRKEERKGMKGWEGRKAGTRVRVQKDKLNLRNE